MLVNPFTAEGRSLLTPIPGTHILEETLGVLGRSFLDVDNPNRIWTVHALYTPVPGRRLGGLRAKVYDQKGFCSFCNQRDLEVLLGLASSDTYCAWLDQQYVEPTDPEWIGLGVDSDDLLDDLYDRELEARAMYPVDAVLPPGLEFERRIHDGANNDYIERLMLLNDMDFQHGCGPDLRMETIERRWVSIERTEPRERMRLWKRT